MKPLTKKDKLILYQMNKRINFEIESFTFHDVRSAVQMFLSELRKDIDEGYIDEDYNKMEELMYKCFPIFKEKEK